MSSAQQLASTATQMRHRGPDNTGFYRASNCILSHNRLSVIDLSDDANQPMHTADGRWAIVFNGEVYNYQQLRKKVVGQLRTNSDTEVILSLFSQFGPDVIGDLNGMFAAAVWDNQEEQLHLFRDRLGIKPLFYHLANEAILFGSEIKALLPLLTGGGSLDPSFLSSYLHLGFGSQSLTAYSRLQQLPPGTYASFKDGILKLEKYWQISGPTEWSNHGTESVVVSSLNELVTSSVSYRMIADVPLGTFLSGGIDSSLVTAVAQSLSDKPVKTFSIGFKESKYDESRYAAQVARALGTDHHPFTVSLKRAQDLLDTVIGAYDEPFGDSSSIPTMLVSELAREHVTVALSGDGGDETHLGYGAYTWAKRLNSPLGKLGKLAAIPLSLLPQDRYRRASWMFRAPSKDLTAAHILSQEQYAFSLKELDTLLLEPPSTAAVDQFRWNVSQDPVDNQSRFDLNFYLPDDLLVKVDRASMYHSLEVRVPLLDHRLVEFALNLPTGLRMKNGEHKYLLKQVLYRYLDPKLFDRPKWGFSIPIEYWIQHDWAELISAYLNEEAVKKTGILNPKAVTKLRDRFAKGETYLYKRIWLLFVLQKWLLDFRAR